MIDHAPLVVEDHAHSEGTDRRGRLEAREVQDTARRLASSIDSVLSIEAKNAVLYKHLKRATEEALSVVQGAGYAPFFDAREYPDTRMFVTFPLLTEVERESCEKCDVPVVCFGINARSLDDDGRVSLEVIVEDRNHTHYNTIHAIDLQAVQPLIADFARNLGQWREHAGIASPAWQGEIQKFLAARNIDAVHTGKKVPRYEDILLRGTENHENLKDLDWLSDNFRDEIGVNVDQGKERLVQVEIGEKHFEFLLSGDMVFLMRNTSTLDVIDEAIKEGILENDARESFISHERERELMKQTTAQDKELRAETGNDDLRKQDRWKNAHARYEYDPVRGLYYLQIAEHPVMDQFETGYIQLLGANAAKYGGAVLEVGFGMGISATAIQDELAKRHTEDNKCVHIIIEYNKEVAERARAWGRRQKVPVIVLEGDWREQITKIPKGILSGSLSDPYPLTKSEKHKDAALALTEIHHLLRPGGISVHYSDSQYCLSKEHQQIAEDAGFRYFGSTTASFGNKHGNTGEYYGAGMKMMVPALYKEGGTGSSHVERLGRGSNAEKDEIKRLLAHLFIERPTEFRATHKMDPQKRSDLLALPAASSPSSIGNAEEAYRSLA